MKLFKCQHCGQMLYFENVTCEQCGHRLGYLPTSGGLFALEPAGDLWQVLARQGGTVRFCDNAAYGACNWLLPVETRAALCACCGTNRTIPDLSIEPNSTRWRAIEAAKHRLFYALLRLRLPVANRVKDPEHGLAFDILADSLAPVGPKVRTGHDNGVITIALAEADDVERERRRAEMREPYRTLLGHFRHEIGHYYWDVLVRDGGKLDECRAVFGDDSLDYGTALNAHYLNGPPADWQLNYVSAYASTHPWEDWAETWAHYLHIIDTLEMASAFGIRVKPRVSPDETLAADIDIDPYAAITMADIIDAWLPLCFAVNNLNRAMGSADLYPFILSPPVIEKLGFVHRLVHRHATEASAQGADISM